MDERLPKRIKLEEDAALPAPSLESLEDMTVGKVRLVIQSLDTLQEAYQAELQQLLEQLAAYRDAVKSSADAAAAAAAGQGGDATPGGNSAGGQQQEAAAEPGAAAGTPRAAAEAPSPKADAAAAGAAAEGAAPERGAAAEAPAEGGAAEAAAAEAPAEGNAEPRGEPAAGVQGAAEPPPAPRSQHFEQQLQQLAAHEGLVSALTAQDLDDADALACLCGAKARYLIKRYALTIGRDTQSKGTVDVDLGQEGDAGQVSRNQAQLSLGEDGAWCVRAVGRQRMAVDGRRLAQGEAVELRHLSLVEVGHMKLLFLVNPLAVRRMLERAAQVVL